MMTIAAWIVDTYYILLYNKAKSWMIGIFETTLTTITHQIEAEIFCKDFQQPYLYIRKGRYTFETLTAYNILKKNPTTSVSHL